MKICISAEVNSNLNLIMQITTQGHDLWSKYKQRASEGALKTAITSLIFHDFGKIIPVMNFLRIEDTLKLTLNHCTDMIDIDKTEHFKGNTLS